MPKTNTKPKSFNEIMYQLRYELARTYGPDFKLHTLTLDHKSYDIVMREVWEQHRYATPSMFNDSNAIGFRLKAREYKEDE